MRAFTLVLGVLLVSGCTGETRRAETCTRELIDSRTYVGITHEDVLAAMQKEGWNASLQEARAVATRSSPDGVGMRGFSSTGGEPGGFREIGVQVAADVVGPRETIALWDLGTYAHPLFASLAAISGSTESPFLPPRDDIHCIHGD